MNQKMPPSQQKKKKDDRYRTAGAGKNPHGVRVVRSFVTTWTWPPSMWPSNWVNNEGGSTSAVFFFPFATLSALHQQFFFFNCVSLYFRPSRGQSRVLISWNLYQQHRGRVFFASPTHSPRLVEREKEKWSNTYRLRFKKKRQTHQLLHKVVKLV